MPNLVKKIISRVLPGDSTAQIGIVWNVGSFVVVGVSGILVNIIISLFYDATVLGVFNQVLSFYIVAGQIGAFGLHNAAIYFLPRQSSVEEVGSLFSTFVLLSALISFVCALLLYTTAGPIATYIFKSRSLAVGLLRASPAVFLFSINKVVLGFINSMRCMKAFAVLQGLRYILMILFIVFIAVWKYDGSAVSWSLFFAEAVVFLCASIFVLRRIRPALPKSFFLKQGASFGSKSMVGGIVGELNTKADIIVLGILTTDSIVGTYSFAAILAEGFYSLIVVFRNNMNPMFAQMLYRHELDKFKKLSRQLHKTVFPLCGLGAVLITIFFWGLSLLLPQKGYQQGVFPLAIILACMALASSQLVKGNVLTQMGRPELDTITTTLTLCVNIILNFLFIPYCGMIGAALATGMSYVFYAGAINFLLKKLLPSI